MNAPFSAIPVQSDADRLDRIVAEWEARFGKPFRDPEPTEAEIAEARERADEAVRGLVTAFPGNLPRGGLFDRRGR